MNKYLIKLSSYLIPTTCIVWGVLFAIYVSDGNLQQLVSSSATLVHAEEGDSLQEEGIRRDVFVSPTPALGGIFSESDNKRNTQDHPSHDLLHSAQYQSIVGQDLFALFNSVKVSFSIRNRSIYLLYCSFLI
ncbi:hypothetical protein [Catalinimonas niigatensis]|uniref:hypothetical protein n=1 Tax=Catalinimonas niigatensis TaxID=1397264 RepID=UPI002665349E|nr:hypothetical protein [Catalinimonas niigatensis]WPP51925.1 hypothetical protein PZB72_05935 [Catalinimonas niigatensis]